MNARLEDILQIIAVQHLWQSAVLFSVTTVLLKVCPLKTSARSWIWLCVLALAALAPLTVFAPSVASTRSLPFTPADIHTTAHQDLPVIAPIAPASPAAPDVVSSSSLAGLKRAVLLVWLLGAAWHLCGLWRAWQAARRLRRCATDMARLQNIMHRDLKEHYSTKICDGIATPMVVGLLHPCILIPRALATNLSDANLVDVLNHEIAHIRRADPWASVAQRFLMALYWWSPVLGLIGGRLDLVREMACDEQAATRTGKPKAYAGSLLACIDILARPEQRDLLGSHMFGPRKALTQRIEELLDIQAEKRRPRRFMSLLVWGVSMTAVVGVTYAATPRVDNASGHAVSSAEAGAAGLETARRLLEATHAGRVDLVRALIAGGANIDAGVDGEGTALIVAARDGNQQMVDALLGMGAKVDHAWPANGNPLIAAILGGQPQVVEKLVAAGANPNANTIYDETPLINAAREGRLDIVKYLVEHGAKVSLGVWADGQRWRTPLNQARGSQVKAYLLSKGAR